MKNTSLKTTALAILISFGIIACSSGGGSTPSVNKTGSSSTAASTAKTGSTSTTGSTAKTGSTSTAGNSGKTETSSSEKNNTPQTPLYVAIDTYGKSHTKASDAKMLDSQTSYGSYGYFDLVQNGKENRTYFYEIADKNSILTEVPTGLNATYEGKVYSTSFDANDKDADDYLYPGKLKLNIVNNQVSGTIDFTVKDHNFLITLHQTSLTDKGYSGRATHTSSEFSAEGQYQGVLAGGADKTAETFGVYRVENNGSGLVGAFSGSKK